MAAPRTRRKGAGGRSRRRQGQADAAHPAVTPEEPRGRRRRELKQAVTSEEPRGHRRRELKQEDEESKAMSDTGAYGPGRDAVGLPIVETTGTPTPGESFDFRSVFGQVKDWLVKNDDKIIRVVVPWLKKQIKGQGLEQGFDLPLDTPITALVQPSMVSRLSPSLKKLTKGDLLALGGWGVPYKSPMALGLSAKDIQTIRDVFTPQIKTSVGFDDEPDAWSISCCSCTPCCCAAAVTKPIRVLA